MRGGATSKTRACGQSTVCLQNRRRIGSMRDFLLADPTGVLWRVGQDLAKAGTSKQSADNR